MLTEFASEIKNEHGCEQNTRKCKMYSIHEEMCKEARREGHIPDILHHINEGVFVNESGEVLTRIVILNIPVDEKRYVEAFLRQKAREVGKVTRQYVEDLEEQYPHELWRMLQFSL